MSAGTFLAALSLEAGGLSRSFCSVFTCATIMFIFFLFHYNPAFPKGEKKKKTELCCKRSQLKQVITFPLAEFTQIAVWMAVFAYVFGNSKRRRLVSQQNVEWVFGMVKGYYRDLQGFCICVLYFAISGESILKYSL